MEASPYPIVDPTNDHSVPNWNAARALNDIPNQIKSAVLDYLGTHPLTTFETNELSIRSDNSGRIEVRSTHGFQTPDDIPPLTWVELLHQIAADRAEEIEQS